MIYRRVALAKYLSASVFFFYCKVSLSDWGIITIGVASSLQFPWNSLTDWLLWFSRWTKGKKRKVKCFLKRKKKNQQKQTFSFLCLLRNSVTVNHFILRKLIGNSSLTLLLFFFWTASIIWQKSRRMNSNWWRQGPLNNRGLSSCHVREERSLSFLSVMNEDWEYMTID